MKKLNDRKTSDDELDLFMAEIEKEIISQKDGNNLDSNKGVREDIEQQDDQETYFKYIEEHVPVEEVPDNTSDYNSDGGISYSFIKQPILPLSPVDHSTIVYPSFERNFYTPHEDVKKLTRDQIEELRNTLNISVVGDVMTSPGISFAYFGLDHEMLDIIIRHGYHTPTPIQAQAIPIVLSGKDLLAIAQTGTGKTAAYLIPMMVHVISQPELQPNDGPIALVCCPTRELGEQIYIEARKFARAYNLKVGSAFGGANMHNQQLELKEGVEILIATPGRLIDLVKNNSTNLKRVTFIVFDEADRLFELGFDAQVQSISLNVRPDRQSLLFSATFKKKVETLCLDSMKDPIKVIFGQVGQANKNITQEVIVLEEPADKITWLLNNIVRFSSYGNVLIFVARKESCMTLSKTLRDHNHAVGVIHGDYTQVERNHVMKEFKHQRKPILIATDVAARGLDIPAIKIVVNYDVAKDIDTHVHRIGRTGRAGEAGEAFTLVTKEDIKHVPVLLRHLENSNQQIPEQLCKLAMPNLKLKNVKKKDKPNRSSYVTKNVTPSTSFHSTKLNSIKQSLAEDYQKFKIASTISTSQSMNLKRTSNDNVKFVKKPSRWDS